MKLIQKIKLKHFYKKALNKANSRYSNDIFFNDLKIKIIWLVHYCAAINLHGFPKIEEYQKYCRFYLDEYPEQLENRIDWFNKNSIYTIISWDDKRIKNLVKRN